MGLNNGNLFRNVLQLTHIARPRIGHKHRPGIFCELDSRHPVLLCKVRGKLAEQQGNVVATLTQGRYLDGNGIQTIEQVFAKTSFSNGLSQIHIGSRNNADIGLLHFGRTYLNIFATFQDTQQTGLGSHRKFTDLIQEDGSSIGFGKITVTVTNGTRKGTLFMTEQFRINGTFGNGTTVHGNIFSMLSPAEQVDDLRKAFLTYPTLTGNQHRQVGRSYLHGNVDGAVQALGIANDSKTEFDILNFCFYHNMLLKP